MGVEIKGTEGLIDEDQKTALSAYEAALAGAEAGQVLTASGPGAAGFVLKRREYIAELSFSSSVSVSIKYTNFPTLTWSRLDNGHYRCTAASDVFTEGTAVITSSTSIGAGAIIVQAGRVSTTVIEMYFLSAATVDLINVNNSLDSYPIYILSLTP